LTRAPGCLSCDTALRDTLVDLGEQPLANSYPSREQLARGNEPRYPLHARVCAKCLLVQVEPVVPPTEIFTEYPYFSSYSASWLEHTAEFARLVIDRLRLDERSIVVEAASNDGYLLRNFVDAGIPVLGIEPARNVAAAAIAAGVPTEVGFLGRERAAAIVEREQAADLVVANNVLAHVPDLDDFVGALHALLKPAGVLTIEVPHVLRMIERVEFDTIYHEHLSYFSLLAAQDVLSRRGLRIFDVDELPTHGGSLRLWACRRETDYETKPAVKRVLEAERTAGLDSVAGYSGFSKGVESLLRELRRFVEDAKSKGSRIAAYGAAAKGSTLLNTAAFTTDEIDYVVDRNPHKQGRFMPGSRLPILEPGYVLDDRPDFLLLLAWNLRDEIINQMARVRDWGCQFVVPGPRLELVP
jgi:SAM-dependent methyltransferase